MNDMVVGGLLAALAVVWGMSNKSLRGNRVSLLAVALGAAGIYLMYNGYTGRPQYMVGLPLPRLDWWNIF